MQRSQDGPETRVGEDDAVQMEQAIGV